MVNADLSDNAQPQVYCFIFVGDSVTPRLLCFGYFGLAYNSAYTCNRTKPSLKIMFN